ncbi:hypothetical protein PFICI_02302 [Pestalotiopsis fici W106-1]|uniref:O-methyltransferase dimerisation domain-containing protein n=1 Tax=Pestalotiopsis fici (strain W106-1 / CGMCC3.15140) TaxID=1229662 RepID=W3XFU3_PESFW|nr:uncharacterized protein PFICI_02302 [Pestalotiopsis fici W106-1]ETS84277.1 hypothetical protein PFICI_02302 [Pestalotiopsis fici W106-1]
MASDSSNTASQTAIVACISFDQRKGTKLIEVCFQPTRTAALRVAVDLKLFETAVQDNGRPKTDEDFAAAVGASSTLVKRIARACVSMDMLDEQGPGLYVPNDVTRLLSKPEYVGGIIHWYAIVFTPDLHMAADLFGGESFDITQLSFSRMPEYLRNTKFQTPENALDGPFQYANKCGSAFAWLSDRPDNF